ncbi:hypothetical protein RAA17_04425 [Komagataeibacter rhaeticus]|nr:hypothetical protein [Komagataeibacter rhaeticus]
MRVAIVTLMVVLLFPATGEPFSRPLQRIASIMTGVVVSFAVSFFVLRNEARREVLGNAASLLRRLADLLTGALHQHPDNDALATVDGMCRSCCRTSMTACRRRRSSIRHRLRGMIRWWRACRGCCAGSVRTPSSSPVRRWRERPPARATSWPMSATCWARCWDRWPRAATSLPPPGAAGPCPTGAV